MSKPVTKIDFAKAMAELEAIVETLESGDTDLDAALPKFERGMELAGQLKRHLQNVQNQVEVVKQRFADPSPKAD